MLKSHIKKFNPDLVFLSETKALYHQAEVVARNLNFNNFWVVERKGLGGGLLLMWSDKLAVKVLNWNLGNITAG